MPDYELRLAMDAMIAEWAERLAYLGEKMANVGQFTDKSSEELDWHMDDADHSLCRSQTSTIEYGYHEGDVEFLDHDEYRMCQENYADKRCLQKVNQSLDDKVQALHDKYRQVCETALCDMECNHHSFLRCKSGLGTKTVATQTIAEPNAPAQTICCTKSEEAMHRLVDEIDDDDNDEEEWDNPQELLMELIVLDCQIRKMKLSP